MYYLGMNTYEISKLVATARRLGWEAADGADMLPTQELIARVMVANMMRTTASAMPRHDRELIVRAYEASFNDNL